MGWFDRIDFRMQLQLEFLPLVERRLDLYQLILCLLWLNIEPTESRYNTIIITENSILFLNYRESEGDEESDLENMHLRV